VKMIEVVKGTWINFDLVLEVSLLEECLEMRCVGEELWYKFDKERLVKTRSWWEDFLNESR